MEGSDPVFGALPITEQFEACGRPGHRIRLSEPYLADLNATRLAWGRPAMLLVKEWAKYRYGVFDDQGYPGDSFYPAHFIAVEGDNEYRVLPTGTTNAMVRGRWETLGDGRHSSPTENCDPRKETCLFRPLEGTNGQVTCSINFLPFLPSVRAWCNNEQSTKSSAALNPMTPSKHNVLCKGRSVMEVINSHPDFNPSSSTPPTPNSPPAVSSSITEVQPPSGTVFHIVRQPPPEYVIILETSAGMASVWKWVRKALQNLIRFELADNSRLAIVTFNKGARLEQNLAVLTSEAVRTRVADTIPDSANKLSREQERCVNCGVQVAMDQVT